MSLENTMWIMIHLLCFSMALQAIEIFALSRKKSFQKIWSYENLYLDLKRGLPLPEFLRKAVFSITGLRAISLIQLSLCMIGPFYPTFLIFMLLLLTHLIICIRFRGTFNGGSDMMTFVILTGILISYGSSDERYQKLGLIYITIHTLYSYFKAGLVKVRYKEWRNGHAVPAFLERSLFLDMKTLAQALRFRPQVSRVLGLGVIGFELSSLALPLFPSLSFLYFALAASFHFLNFLCFGLNRFFWIWLTAWPAVLFSLKLTGS